MKRVRSVEDDNGVTLDDLRTALTVSPAWADIKDNQSRICRVLKHPVFEKQPGTGIIDVSALICFALYHCQGSSTAKATAFYEVFQDGGVAKQKSIGAFDNEF